ncbi:MAG: hypothetical protein ACN2B6_03165 [Rickettsiales bacterium]
MKPIDTPQPLSTEQENAIAWYADQQVEAALREGVISEALSNEHWMQSACDLLDDPELLAKMVGAHKQFEKTGEGDGMSVVLEHYGMMEDKGDEPPTAEQIENLMAARRKPHSGMTKMAVALTLASAVGVVPAHSQANGMHAGHRQPPIRQEHDIPPARPPRPEREKRWVDRTGKDGDSQELC